VGEGYDEITHILSNEFSEKHKKLSSSLSLDSSLNFQEECSENRNDGLYVEDSRSQIDRSLFDDLS
jgi:hypothetical protein